MEAQREKIFQIKDKRLTDGEPSVFMAESSLNLYCDVLNIDHKTLMKKEVTFNQQESEFYQ